MATTQSEIDAAAAWNNASAIMNRYLSILVFLFGTVGNLLNALVLSQGTLRRNPCSLFFLISSLANLVAIVSGLTTRMLSGWTLDLTNTIDSLCKIRAFALFLSRNIASWLILLASIDRWLLSSTRAAFRRMSSFRNAQRGIALIIFLSSSLYAPIFYCYQANLRNTPLRCYGHNEACRWLNDISYAFLTIIVPICVMLVFGLLTILNIRKVKTQVNKDQTVGRQPTGTRSIEMTFSQTVPAAFSKRKIDRRLFLMLFIQILLLALFTLPQAFQKLYSTVVANQIQTELKRAIDNFVFNFVLLLTYVANGMPFYIYTLTGGSLFRNAFKDLLKNIAENIFCVCFRVNRR